MLAIIRGTSMSELKYLIIDVDGTLTDGKIYMGATGEICKAFHVKDGCGIHDLLIPAGIIPIIITGRESDILKLRCEELGIHHLYQNVGNKLKKLEEIMNDTEYKHTAYIGDDINDLECMKAVKETGGLIGCPLDAVQKVRETADFISTKRGGEGAVREFIDWILREDSKAD